MIPRRNLKSFLSGFAFAFQGLLEAIRTQFNIRFHFAATVVVLAMGFYFDLSAGEWCFILLSIGLMLSAEFLNTAIEYTHRLCFARVQ
jgi:diacylglycerol kinase